MTKLVNQYHNAPRLPSPRSVDEKILHEALRRSQTPRRSRYWGLAPALSTAFVGLIAGTLLIKNGLYPGPGVGLDSPAIDLQTNSAAESDVEPGVVESMPDADVLSKAERTVMQSRPALLEESGLVAERSPQRPAAPSYPELKSNEPRGDTRSLSMARKESASESELDRTQTGLTGIGWFHRQPAHRTTLYVTGVDQADIALIGNAGLPYVIKVLESEQGVAQQVAVIGSFDSSHEAKDVIANRRLSSLQPQLLTFESLPAQLKRRQ